ncbi:hypothetical protein R5K30_20675, partial [Acinetobacter baumannii]|nr:hypothetical protein [Acinetobacter baumannii]
MAIRFRAAHDHAVAAEAKEKDEDGKKALGDFKKDIESGIPFSAQRYSELEGKAKGTASWNEFQRLNNNL